MKLTIFLLFFLLSACVKVIPAPDRLHIATKNKVREQSLSRLQDFEAIGKVGFSDGTQAGNVSLIWEQHPERYQIRLYGPLGTYSVQIQGEANRVSLTKPNGQIITARTPEGLVLQALGFVMPVSGLRYWLRGLPAPGPAPQKMLLDHSNRLWQMDQQGWHIDYQAYKNIDGRDLPYKLFLTNHAVRLKFIFNRWRLSE